jgi:hypothetical protein
MSIFGRFRLHYCTFRFALRYVLEVDRLQTIHVRFS